MPTFASRPLGIPKAGLNGFLRQHPLAFGVSFVVIIVGASFGLKGFTDVGVEKKDGKITVVGIMLMELA
jgi:cytochrome c oxidase assembly protein subunit 16